MARKKKNGNSAMVIAFILICVMALVWYFTSSDNGFLSFKDNEEQQDILDDDDEIIDNQVDELVTVDDTVNIDESDNTEDTSEELIEEVVEELDTTFDETGFDLSVDTSILSNETISWSWRRNEEHIPVEIYSPYSRDELADLGAYYNVDTEEKVIYLTFDAGYENGYTESILDTLLEYNIKAAFFVTKTYIEYNPEITIRMKDEGHIVGNHSSTHPSFPDLTDDEIAEELDSTAETMAQLTGYDMDLFFRPPEATYSERTLYVARKLGYRTIFYSMAYVDWDRDNQPGAEVALDHVMTNYHDGCVMLLHAVSSSNAEALGDIITELQNLGYRFGYLYEVE